MKEIDDIIADFIDSDYICEVCGSKIPLCEECAALNEWVNRKVKNMAEKR